MEIKDIFSSYKYFNVKKDLFSVKILTNASQFEDTCQFLNSTPQ